MPRLTYSEIRRDERKESAVLFLERALAWVAGRYHRVQTKGPFLRPDLARPATGVRSAEGDQRPPSPSVFAALRHCGHARSRGIHF